MCKGFPNKSSSAANTPVTLNLRAEQCKHENTRPLDTQPSLCSTVEGGQYCGDTIISVRRDTISNVEDLQ